MRRFASILLVITTTKKKSAFPKLVCPIAYRRQIQIKTQENVMAHSWLELTGIRISVHPVKSICAWELFDGNRTLSYLTPKR